ncbi:hypothetical protein TRFO_38110 [Tritrichomonas foetus]|uniref:PAS domain-containing protein n=1 Tax=Tritrichomonas foetus TaxID=1144522 RepID=A0A1J4JES0_9EUKA|nr:hypothetical protein TRFO_38110 [Tritrichomonas foetus]|eukprot:OHS95756.1 hypothetical protein TRFO_38110 [Tritrichomonas foetus]
MKFYFHSVIIFLWLNYILFQQVERMNMTVFYPCCMIFASIVFVETLKRLIFMWPGEEFQGFLFGISLFFVLANISSAIYGYNNLKNNRIEAWNSKIESTVNWIIQNTPKKAVFISTEENFDIVTTLAGKVQFLQSSELCKLYGFNHLNRSSEIDELLKNPNSQNLAFKVEYFVCVEDSNKKREMNTNNGNWTLEYNRHNILIYKRNLIRKK